MAGERSLALRVPLLDEEDPLTCGADGGLAQMGIVTEPELCRLSTHHGGGGIARDETHGRRPALRRRSGWDT